MEQRRGTGADITSHQRKGGRRKRRSEKRGEKARHEASLPVDAGPEGSQPPPRPQHHPRSPRLRAPSSAAEAAPSVVHEAAEAEGEDGRFWPFARRMDRLLILALLGLQLQLQPRKGSRRRCLDSGREGCIARDFIVGIQSTYQHLSI
ncbi:hypothetical protein GW17_00033191 [Ensete ventricosum]|nr:hypothetical protein GW17_00033191 [Ensete ventricosum]